MQYQNTNKKKIIQKIQDLDETGSPPIHDRLTLKKTSYKIKIIQEGVNTTHQIRKSKGLCIRCKTKTRGKTLCTNCTKKQTSQRAKKQKKE